MTSYVVVGAGAAGSATARLLAGSGAHVRLITRRGGGPADPRVERVAADAGDTARLAELVSDARVLFNCAMPRYDRWPAEFPPLATSLLGAAEQAGADYVILANVYGYGLVDGPLTEDLPLAPSSVKGEVRARIWHEAKAAHDAGRLRVTEVRGSDFLGAGAVSPFTMLVGAQVLAGAPVHYPGDLDAPHSWSYTVDTARTLVAAAHHEESWGRAWHVPSTSDATVRELAVQLAEAAGAPAPELHHMPLQVLRDLGRTDSIVAELPEMLYLFDRPTIVDASLSARTLEVTASPLDVVLAETAAEQPVR